MREHFFLFVFVLSLTMFQSINFIDFERWHIHILNGLSHGQSLFVHCKSKDDDLGIHDLSFGSEFNWSFRVNFWGTTLFWCYLRKSNDKSVSFEAFWVEKTSIWLYYRCYKYNCIWTAKHDGIYLKDNPVGRDVLVHRWK